MGWTYLHNHMTPENYIRRMFTWENENGKGEIVDLAKVGNTFYAAIHLVLPDKDIDGVYASVILTSNPEKEYLNFGYKVISEDCGPVESQCPVRILNKLSPTDSEWANEWRKRCRLYHERVNALHKLQVYSRIRSCGFDLQLTPVYRYNENPRLYWFILENGKPTNKYIQKSRILRDGWEAI